MLKIITSPDPLLNQIAEPCEIGDKSLKKLAKQMERVMYDTDGVGIAAPQVGVLRRVFIVDVGDEHGLIEFINPEILEASGSQTDNEGCLSVPGKTCEVERPSHIKVKALDRNGNEFELEADDLLARCICHENDHLNGILFIDKSVDGKIYKTENAED